MTRKEFLESKEYKDMMNKIKGYSKGFTFTIPFYKMTQGQKKGMNIVLDNACKEGLIESLSISLSLECNVTEEEYRRL